MRDKITQDQQMRHTPVEGNSLTPHDYRYMTYQTSHCTEQNQRIENQSLKKDSRSHSYVFNLRIRDQRPTIIHKQQHSLVQKYLSDKFEEQGCNSKGFTPFQSRKIDEKSRAMKNFSKFKNYKNNQKSLQQNQKECLLVKEIAYKKEIKQQKLTSTCIRQTQTSLKDQQNQDNYLLSTQLTEQSPKSTLKMQEYLTKDKQIYKTTNKVKFKNVKMTLKQLFKNNKSLLFNSTNKLDPNFAKQSIKNNLSVICNSNSNLTKITRVQRRFFEVISQKDFHKQKQKCQSLQSQNKIMKRTQIQSHIASAISIVPYNKQSMNKNQQQKQMSKSYSSKKSYCSHANCQSEQRSKYRSIKKIPSSKQINKQDKYQFEGWEYTNDFSERQQFF